MKNLTLLFVLFITSFCFAGDRVELYKNEQLREINVHEKIVYRTVADGMRKKLKVYVGEAENGKISSYSIEVLNSDQKLEDIINIDIATQQVSDFITYHINSVKSSGDGGPTDIKANCFSDCNNKWRCDDQPSQVGTMLCATDCFIECYMISKPVKSLTASIQ